MRGDIALFLGLVAVIGGGVIVAVVLLAGDGGGNNPCDQPLPPLGNSEISQLGFQTEDVGLTRVIQAATVGNLPAVEDAFFGDVHNFTHDVDAAVRREDPELAEELCRAVITLEEDLFSSRPDPITIASGATRVRELLRDAAEALGYVRPGQ